VRNGATSAQGTRERLVAAASVVIHAEGYSGTTLARVAQAAKVPLGNVYYWFHTKEALAEAVIDARVDELNALMEEAGRKSRPQDRLAALLIRFASGCAEIARLGCPYGTLAQELEKRDDKLARRARRIFAVQRNWMARQFRELGARDPDARALELLAGMQGAALLAHALRNPKVLKARLDALVRGVRATPFPV
jgi:AcrR family transcriptional regulator